MASMAMTPAFLRGTGPKHPSTTTTTTGRQRGVIVMAKASKVSEGVSFKNEHDSGSGRRDLVFAAAAAAVWSVAKVAAADEPKPGSPEAKKKYAAVCVTMPTARICRKGPSTS
ncbi:hypothetical protein RHMOL_Rhmol01G0259900 [Rhododendron molle]|uniref:Uncharacterized protein n=1 Tax=Rhododendron molle TaxID=49168 RepID=A0ACC0Q756_RHOML|nr:hypothetical protein RHMOL_Rhmol01G0259900 [Rhododendron molle]